MNERFDLVVVGAGTAGMPAAMEAATRGLKVALVEKSDRVGGTLHYSSGQMSGAGTRLQRARGIHDTPDLHFEDVMRISRGTADRGLVRRAVELGGETIDWLMDHGFEMHPACPAMSRPSGFGSACAGVVAPPRRNSPGSAWEASGL